MDDGRCVTLRDVLALVIASSLVLIKGNKHKKPFLTTLV